MSNDPWKRGPAGYGHDSHGGHGSGTGPYGQSTYGGSIPSAEAQVRMLEEAMRRIAEAPLGLATVASVDKGKKRMILSLGPGGLVQVARHPGAKVGDQVLVARDTMGIVEVMPGARPTGFVATALDVSPGLAEVEFAQARRVVRTPFQVAPGERLIIDPSMVYVVGSLGMPKPAHVAPETRVDWDDIGGNEEAKEELREGVELPFQHPELYAAYGKKPPRGIMMSGPPGCGKTMLGKATATSLARSRGRDNVAAGGFQYIKGPEILNKWLGESEAAIRAIFAEARAFKAEYGYPCVIFLDEADALLGDRARGTNVSINATTVPQFLAEMDGFDEPAAIVILATNRPDMLDAAVTREGRVDCKVRVGRPSRRDAAQILAIHLRGRPLEPGLDREETARRVADRIFTPGALIVRDYTSPLAGTLLRLELRHMVNGAMLARVVERATTTALYRDISGGQTAAGGVRLADLIGALENVRLGQRDVDHGSVLREIAELETVPGADSPASRSGDERTALDTSQT